MCNYLYYLFYKPKIHPIKLTNLNILENDIRIKNEYIYTIKHTFIEKLK